jgi:hypothetical protein
VQVSLLCVREAESSAKRSRELVTRLRACLEISTSPALADPIGDARRVVEAASGRGRAAADGRALFAPQAAPREPRGRPQSASATHSQAQPRHPREQGQPTRGEEHDDQAGTQ